MDSTDQELNLSWRALFHATATPTCVLDKEHMVVDANRAFCEFSGYPRAATVGSQSVRFAVPSDRQSHDKVFRKHLELGGRYLHERGFLHADGHIIQVRMTATVVELKQRFLLIEYCVKEDERLQHPGLIQSHDLLHQVIDKAPIIVFIRDREGRFVMVNALYASLLGMPPDELEGKTPRELFDRKHAEEYLLHDKKVIESDAVLSFEETTEIEGEERYWVSIKTPLHDIDGRVIGVGGMSSEVTDRKRAEEQLRGLNRNLEMANHELRSMQDQLIQAEKMESVGRLAAGVAHEVKNPLALILMGVEYLSQMPEDSDPNLVEILDEMRKAVRRAEKIVHGLVDFSSTRQLEIEEVDVNRIVRDTLLFIKHDRLRQGVDLVKSLAPTLCPVHLDVQKFEQVLLNVLINALHAMAKGGTLRVWTQEGVVTEGDPTDPGSRAAERLRKGDAVVMVGVEDTGSGIAPKDLERIFDPFFTTKATGEGTGLGLSICRKIVELHGGRLVAHSEVGRGTTMTIMLKALSGEKEDKKSEKKRDKSGAEGVQ